MPNPTTPTYPANWLMAQDWKPNDHMMQLKGKDYLTVQNRLLWFLRDQRALIVAGLATTTHVVRTEIVEHDRQTGWAHFMTYVRDVLGNEATMYGSESKQDFGDYAEKASTKSLGRALACLGYGTGSAPEMDEGERVVDAPVERTTARPAATSARAPQPQRQPTIHPINPNIPATAEQLAEVEYLAAELGMDPPNVVSEIQATLTIKSMRQRLERRRPAATAATGTPALEELPTGTRAN